MAQANVQSGDVIGGISSAAVRAATGKSWKQWCTLLDKAGGRSMNHKEIVAVVGGKYDVGPWWQQMVTVGYEQAAGLRKKHEKPEGFQISRSKTYAVPASKVFAAWSTSARRAAWLGNKSITVRKSTRNKNLRVTWSDGKTSLDVQLVPKGAAKTQLTVQHSKLPSSREAEKMKSYWSQTLARLATALGS